MRWSSVTLVFLWSLGSAPLAWAGSPADDLLKLVAAESGVTLVVEDLRGHARELVASPLFAGLLRITPIRTWINSGTFRKVEKASRDVQEVLGVPLEAIRDELLGDALVLSLQAGLAGRPDQAKGLLLVRPHDRPLIERLIKVVNDAQFQAGELAGAEPRSRGGIKYSARLFKALGRPPEFYVLLDDGIFAWSNSEAMILGVIDRKLSGQPGLPEAPGFQKVRRSLPDRAVASLFVNARFFERAMADVQQRPLDGRSAMIGRYLGAVDQLGLALEWRDGIFLHSCECVAPDKLDPWLKTWLTRPPSPTTLPGLVSASTVAVASVNLDFNALRGAILQLIPDDDRPALENLNLGLKGILMGRDPLTEVLPRLGPGMILSLEIEPNKAIRPHFPLVGAVGWSVPPGAEDLAAPLDNALKTLFALYAFEPKRRIDHLQVEPKTIGEARMTVLTDGLRTHMAYRVTQDRLVVGNSTEAVARFGTGRPPSIITDLRAGHFPEAQVFAIIDLTRMVLEIRSLRGPIARALAARSKRPISSVDRDLDDLMAVAEMFQAATFTSGASRDASEVRRTFGLIAR